MPDPLHRARYIDLRKGEYRCIRDIELRHAAIGEGTIVDSLNRRWQRCHYIVVKLFAALKGLLGNRGKGRVIGPGHRLKCLASGKRIPAQLLNRIGQCDFLDAAASQAANGADVRIGGEGDRCESGVSHAPKAYDMLAVDSRGHLQRGNARVAILDRNFVGEAINREVVLRGGLLAGHVAIVVFVLYARGALRGCPEFKFLVPGRLGAGSLLLLLLLGELLALDKIGGKRTRRCALGLSGARQARRRCNLGGRGRRGVTGIGRCGVGSAGIGHVIGGIGIGRGVGGVGGVYLVDIRLHKGAIGGEHLSKRAHRQRARHHGEGHRGNGQAAAKRSNSSPPHGRSFPANQKSSSVIVVQKQSER